MVSLRASVGRSITSALRDCSGDRQVFGADSARFPFVARTALRSFCTHFDCVFQRASRSTESMTSLFQEVVVARMASSVVVVSDARLRRRFLDCLRRGVPGRVRFIVSVHPSARRPERRGLRECNTGRRSHSAETIDDVSHTYRFAAKQGVARTAIVDRIGNRLSHEMGHREVFPSLGFLRAATLDPHGNAKRRSKSKRCLCPRERGARLGHWRLPGSPTTPSNTRSSTPPRRWFSRNICAAFCAATRHKRGEIRRVASAGIGGLG